MTERCDWNPVFKQCSSEPRAPGDCPNEATVSIGRKGHWHVCDSCAQDEKFKQYTVRTPLRRADTSTGNPT